MSSKDNIGDRMKHFERFGTDTKLIPNLPVIVRLDGKGFSKFTKGMKRPYDERMSAIMIETTKFLVKEFSALVGYTQSDEITLVFKNDYYIPMAFDGKLSKINSVFAAKCSSFFAMNAVLQFPDKDVLNSVPCFDCRVWNVPSWIEASNAVLWREQDATKNSVAMLAQHHFSHRDLQNKNQKDQLEMLEREDVVWGNCPTFFKRGTYIKRELYEKDVKIPENLQSVASGLPLTVTRSRIAEFVIEPLGSYTVQERVIKLFGDVV